jgi:hypothetical protein
MLWIVVLRCLDAFTTTVLILTGTALFLYPFLGFTPSPIATYQPALTFGLPLIYLIIMKSRERRIERTRVAYERRS